MIVSNTDYRSHQSTTEERLAAAFEALRPRLASRALAIVGDRNDAEDAVQEAAVRAWRSRGRLRSGADPAPWLRSIVTNVAIDLKRTRERDAHEAAPLEESVAAPDSTEDAAVGAEMLREIGNAARRLPETGRRAFLMHDLAGMTSHEIAVREAVPYHTVRTRLRRARHALRNDITRNIA